MGFGLVALGGVGLIAGAVTGVLVLGDKSTVQDPTHCDQITHACDQTGVDAASSGKTLSTVSTVAFAGGGASLVAGVLLSSSFPVTARVTSGARRRRVSATPVVAPVTWAARGYASSGTF